MSASSRGESGLALDLTTLEAVVDQLGAHLGDAATRALRDELASHVLAARVLVDAQASDDALAAVLARANKLLERSRRIVPSA